ncbi:unnamed protein product, partial [Urochloa humidicola]
TTSSPHLLYPSLLLAPPQPETPSLVIPPRVAAAAAAYPRLPAARLAARGTYSSREQRREAIGCYFLFVVLCVVICWECSSAVQP